MGIWAGDERCVNASMFCPMFLLPQEAKISVGPAMISVGPTMGVENRALASISVTTGTIIQI